MKTKPINIVATLRLLLAGILLLLSGAIVAQTQPVVRANTAGPLNLTTAWTNNVAPGSGEQFDSTVGFLSVAPGSSVLEFMTITMPRLLAI